MVKAKNKFFSMFLIFLGIFLFIMSLFYLSNSPLIFIAEVIFSIFLVIVGIFNYKEILTIFLGIFLLILVLIWHHISTADILETISVLISSLFFIIVGVYWIKQKKHIKNK